MQRPITFVINTLMVGGVERLILDIITHLDRDQWAPTVITVLGGGPLLTEFARLGVPVKFIGPKSYTPRSVPYRLYWLINLPAIIWRLRRELRRTAAEVVVTSLYHADIVGMLAASSLKIPKRIVIHHDVERLPKYIAWAKSYLALPRATKVVANSQAVASFLQDYFKVPVDKIVTIFNGIDVRHFADGAKLNTGNELVVGMIGRLEPIKGPTEFVSALVQLKQRLGSEPPAVLAGGGSLLPQLEEQIQVGGLKQLTLTGEVTDPVSVLQDIDILAIPSRAEGFGLIVIEGLAARKLIVASDLPAIRELVVPEETGLLFPVGDSTALASQLQRLLTDDQLRQRLLAGVERWALEDSPRYDISAVVAKYIQLWS